MQTFPSSSSKDGVKRPPLLDFIRWLNSELAREGSVNKCRPSDQWAAAWNEWLAQIISGTTDEQTSFLRSFVVEANQEELSALEVSVLTSICETFQIPVGKASPLFNALTNELRRWTTRDSHVTAEDAYSAMALIDDSELNSFAPPPPTPFFPSRQSSLTQIETALKAAGGAPIIFLCAEPGAGKTSLVSQLME